MFHEKTVNTGFEIGKTGIIRVSVLTIQYLNWKHYCTVDSAEYVNDVLFLPIFRTAVTIF
jgi:hypothetical protein